MDNLGHHPFASPVIIPRRTSSSQANIGISKSRSNMRISSQSSSSPLPPPHSDLPSLPSSVTGHGRTVSISSRSSHVSRRPSLSPPLVTERSSSLDTSVQGQTGYQQQPVSGGSYPFHQSPGSSTPSRSKPSRTPSRHLLQTALDLAQKAVEMDKDNDVTGALAAYREAVTRLKSVMERVNEPLKDESKRKSTGRTEEEGRTLKGIVSIHQVILGT